MSLNTIERLTGIVLKRRIRDEGDCWPQQTTKEYQKMKRIICAGTLLVGAMLFGGIAQGAVTLDIIENSSSSLTASFNGTSIPAADIVLNSSDHWTITLPAGASVSGAATWAESGTTLNEVDGNPALSTVSVISDESGTMPDDANGGIETAQFLNNFGPMTVRFTDNGDGVVPEPSTLFAGALLLLPFGISALRGLRRNRGQ
jgi:hypothetical protein